jgi:hypothetical protein
MREGTEEQPSPALPSGFAPMLLASFLFGMAITFNRGAYSEGALVLVLLGLGILVFCLIEGSRRRLSIERNPRLLLMLIWLGLLAMAFYAWNDEVIIYPVRPWDLGRKTQVASLLLLLTYLPFLTGQWREPRALRIGRFAAFAVVVALGGADVIRASPQPRIDVWTVQQDGAEALRHWKNPYTEVAEAATGPGVIGAVPYVYPPTQVYLTLPAYVLAKDVRFTMLGAILVAGFALRYITARARTGLPSIAQDAPALYLWLMTKLFFILEQAWVDPVQVMLIALTSAAYIARRPMLTAILLGVVLSAKQTMFWAVGLTGVILRFDKKQWATTIGVGTALVLPFVLLDFRALKHANFDLLSGLPTRLDALTFNSWFQRKFGTELPGAVGFLLAATVAAFSMWRMRRSAAQLSIALAATYAFFFAFNRWAFANYYFLMASLSALAAAASCHTAGAGVRVPELEAEAKAS